MQIRYKIALQFTFIVLAILLVFSGIVYLRAENQRRMSFYDRLSRRAKTTARLLVDVKEFNTTLLKIIDQNSSSRLPAEEIFIYDYRNLLLYSNVEKVSPYVTQEHINETRLKQEVKFQYEDRAVIGLVFEGRYDRFVIIASGIDKNGKAQLKDLVITLLFAFLGGIFTTIVMALFFANQSLRPINAINREIGEITAKNLRKRIHQGNGKDEIAQLAINFNLMLERIDQAFQQQRQFVSHASHELRTPLSALKTEIQIGLSVGNTLDDHTLILKNLLSDTDRLIELSNGLLQLARINERPEELSLEEVRMEEVLLNAQQEVITNHSNYQIQFEFDQIPKESHLTLVMGNEALLKNAFANLLENACKYTPNHQATLRLGFDPVYCIVRVIDYGIGIAQQDLPSIFQPFYRAKNALDYQGFGIGLSIVQRIVDLHEGTIEVKSQQHLGTEFVVKLRHLVEENR
ncbi:sensor histidine kinase [Runella sp.]|uniref:sensor histidine kinase n=1 Tax=Runella sp. TaxID=1960881 RepID=UPI003D0C9CC9